jgi:hypothetical protein
LQTIVKEFNLESAKDNWLYAGFSSAQNVDSVENARSMQQSWSKFSVA